MKFEIIVFGVYFTIGLFSVDAWDVAVAVKDQIKFLDRMGGLEGQLSEGMEEVRALAYNARQGYMYFVDNKRTDGTIFQVKVPDNLSAPAEVKVVVSKQLHDVKGLAYDGMTDVLYWTVPDKSAIMFVQVNMSASPQAGQRLLSLPNQSPLSLAIDICKRYLYWSNTAHNDITVERLLLDGSGNRTVIVDEDLGMPNAVVVDQAGQKLFWVDEKAGSEFRIESTDLDGNNRKVIHSGSNIQPFALAVSAGSLFWTDHIKNSVWGLDLDAPRPRQLANYLFSPRALVSANSGSWQRDGCNQVVFPKMVVIPATVTKITEQSFGRTEATDVSQLICRNGGIWKENEKDCDCPTGYSGTYCEVDNCQDYCLHNGECLTHTQRLDCVCAPGYSGSRCERSVCHNYCLFGNCSINYAGQPQCNCQEGYGGQRCEANITHQSSFNPIQSFDFSRCSEVEPLETYPEWNRDYIIVALLAICLILMVFSTVVMRKMMILRKRPRIKKRIIVNKNVTPLTCRPSPTGEQCEITIENCCNMNICETPCYEPDFRQPSATLSKQNGKMGNKEEKRTLLGSMELPPDDLY